MPTAQLDGVALGRQRRGVNLISRIATLREEGRLPIRSIQWYLRTVHQLRLSVGAIVSAIHQTAQQAQVAVAAMVDRIRASPVVHADETGWRQNGNNGYVWTFSTPTERYFLRRGRGKAVVDEALGEGVSTFRFGKFAPAESCLRHTVSVARAEALALLFRSWRVPQDGHCQMRSRLIFAFTVWQLEQVLLDG